jgi:hypothetical protein
MRTREEAERRAGELNGEVPLKLAAGKLFYTVDQSAETGAWRVIEHRQVSHDMTTEMVIAS